MSSLGIEKMPHYVSETKELIAIVAVSYTWSSFMFELAGTLGKGAGKKG